MNIFSKQAIRKPVFTGLMALLLCMAAALLCDGYAAWMSAGAKSREIAGAYTTIAIPIDPVFDGRDIDGYTLALQKRVWADHAAQESVQLDRIDRRGYLAAWLPNARSLSSSAVDPAEYNSAFEDESYSLAVLALRCESVTQKPAGDELLYDAVFQLEEAVCLLDAYSCFPAPGKIHIYSDVREKNGDTPFEMGKTYLVFGSYHDYRVVKSMDPSVSYRQMTQENRYLIPFPEIWSNVRQEPSCLVTGTYTGRTYHYCADGELPWYAEYEGTVDAFLSSDAGTVWAQEVIPLCEKNHQSAAVILTDCATSMYAFNTGEAALLDGRFFSEEEYCGGENVCMVSAAFAQWNGLGIGDSIGLDLYQSRFAEFSNGATANSMLTTEDPGPYRQRFYLREADRLNVCKEYTIVGIYTGARFTFGAYHFNADTILVPKASVPNASEYEYPANSMLNSFILRNGAVEEFEASMLQQDLGGQFLYFDQGFSAVEESLAVLTENARRLLLIGLGVYSLTAVLFLFLNFRRILPTIRGARRIGLRVPIVWWEVMISLLTIESISILLGGIAAAAFYGTITQTLLHTTMAFRPNDIVVPLCTAFCGLVIATALCAVFAVRQKLVKSK